MIEALGVPHSEIEALSVTGIGATFEHIVEDGDVFDALGATSDNTNLIGSDGVAGDDRKRLASSAEDVVGRGTRRKRRMQEHVDDDADMKHLEEELLV